MNAASVVAVLIGRPAAADVEALQPARTCALPSTPLQIPRWSELPSPARAEQAAVLDPAHHRLIVFGGRISDGIGGIKSTNDVWVLQLGEEPRWTRIVPVGESPSPRYGATGVFDPRENRMLVFGGQDSTGLRSDLWALALQGRPKWRLLHPSGPTPAARYRHTATLDPAGRRVIVFGGWGRTGPSTWYLGDVWQLSLSKQPAWSRLEPSGESPSPRSAHLAVLAPDLGGIVIFGGASPQGCPGPLTCAQQTNDVWLLSLTDPPVWTDLTPRITGGPPCGIQAHGAVYDPVERQMVVFDGYSAYGPDTPCFGAISAVWTLSFDDMRWSQVTLPADRPRARYFASTVFDVERRRALVYGGGSGTPYGDVWALNLGATPYWSRIEPPDGIPHGSIFYDPLRDRLVTYGGSLVWSYPLAREERWTAEPVAGEIPPPRRGAVNVLDTRRNRIIVHGGLVGLQTVADTWELRLDDPPTWSRLSTSGDAPQSYLAAAIFDPVRDRMVVCGGLTHDVTNQRNVWALSLHGVPTWTQLTPSGDWRPRGGHAAVYDQRKDRMVVFGGGEPFGDGWGAYDDTWALSLAGPGEWRVLDAGGLPLDQHPGGRVFPGVVQDPVGNRMIVIAGNVPGTFSGVRYDDAWEFRFDDLTWHRIPPQGAPVPLWVYPSAAYDSRRNEALVSANDWLWTLDLGGERREHHDAAIDEVTPATVDEPLSLSVSGPNPFSKGFSAAVSIRGTSAARLELFDIAGRRVWAKPIEPALRQRQIVRADGIAELQPGIYMLKLTQEHQMKTVRLVHVR